MRILYRASLVFLLTDIYGKYPITSASILCNGKQNPYTRKSDGYYVFSNLYPGKYRIDIICKGYMDTILYTEVRENETKIIMTDIPYAVDNTSIRSVSRFQIQVNQNGEPLKETEFNFELDEGIKSVKMIKPVKMESEEIYLNVDMKKGLMSQRYIYTVENVSYDLYISGYDPETKCYLLKEAAKKNIPEGGIFRPYWRLKTNKKGQSMMTYMKLLMGNKKLNFTIKSGEKSGKIKIDMEGKEESGEVIYVETELK